MGDRSREGFVREHWLSILVVCFFAFASIYMRDIIIIAVTVIFILALANLYYKFDSVLAQIELWWRTLDKDTKIEFYNKMSNIQRVADDIKVVEVNDAER